MSPFRHPTLVDTFRKNQWWWRRWTWWLLQCEMATWKWRNGPWRIDEVSSPEIQSNNSSEVRRRWRDESKQAMRDVCRTNKLLLKAGSYLENWRNGSENDDFFKDMKRNHFADCREWERGVGWAEPASRLRKALCPTEESKSTRMLSSTADDFHPPAKTTKRTFLNLGRTWRTLKFPEWLLGQLTTRHLTRQSHYVTSLQPEGSGLIPHISYNS